MKGKSTTQWASFFGTLISKDASLANFLKHPV
jgi:hypothetical protein